MGFSCNCDTNGEQFDRKGAMVANGWRFSGLDKHGYFGKDKHRVCGEAPDTAYCGWSRRKNGFVSKTLTGKGTLTIDFGNPSRKGTTIVELDGKEIARARKRQQRSHTVPFSDQQRLTIREVGGGIVVLTGLIMTSCEDGVQAQAFSSPARSSAKRRCGPKAHEHDDQLAWQRVPLSKIELQFWLVVHSDVRPGGWWSRPAENAWMRCDSNATRIQHALQRH